jgi:hypothetical protein
MHFKDFELCFSITNRIMGTKVDLELRNEGGVVGVPEWNVKCTIVLDLEESGFKPLVCSALEYERA